MTPRIALLLGVHAHQPVGNFASVIEEAHERCYHPFLKTLYRYPDFHFAAHFSGWLLGWLATRFPEDMTLLTRMVARGQVEMFGAGDCEPVLASIPARDRRGQIEALSARLDGLYGERPAGAWLTERVWESCVVPSLVDTGIRYVTVDDYHFLCTGRTASELDGYYTTEEDGARLDLFPISEALRYRLPFSPAAEAVRYLEGLAETGGAAAVYFDDIEKFGIWPETYEWVYERRWLEQFIEGVLASPSIETSTYAAFHARTRTRGIVYLPTASYSEMNEWTLPAQAAATYTALLARTKAGDHWEAERPFVRGGIWRNFLSRYPESNWLHKRMLGLSARLAGAPGGLGQEPGLRELLYRAQANDAYWHGLFGGLYLPHLRRAVWQNLIALEAALDAADVPRQDEPADIDADGALEYVVHDTACQLVLRDDGLAAAQEFVSYLLLHNFGDTLRRHAEHYHQTSDAAVAAAAPTDAGLASAHARMLFKTAVTADDLVLDTTARSLGIDQVRYADGSVLELRDWRLLEGDTRALCFVHRLGDDPDALSKIWRLTADGFELSYGARLPAGAALETLLNLALPSCDGFGGRYVLADGSFPGGFGGELSFHDLRHIALEDADLKGRLDLKSSEAFQLETAPHYTVSQSEAGLEKIMQAAVLRLRWSAPTQILSFGVSICASWL